MSDFAEKTEQPTQRKLEEAQQKGQIPRSPEVQTTLVLLGGLTAMVFFGRETWMVLATTLAGSLGHLHETPVTLNSMQGLMARIGILLLHAAGPIVLSAMIGGLLAGAMQSRFSTASEALALNWERLNPVEGLKRIFSFGSAMPTAISAVKMVVICGLTYSTVREVVTDPIFTSTVSLDRVGAFLAESCLKIFTRVLMALAVVAGADYGYQWWKNHKEMMMTREEVKEESKSQEGNQQIKAGRRRLLKNSQRRMLQEVPAADVVITNPTHIAIALRYDRRTMRAPRIIAKGIRLNAARIRQVAQAHQVPIIENKPLARLLFKHGQVDGEIPAELFLAVAEILAFVYRQNPYRYYSATNQAAD